MDAMEWVASEDGGGTLVSEGAVVFWSTPAPAAAGSVFVVAAGSVAMVDDESE
jgi:hypothetical protein